MRCRDYRRQGHAIAFDPGAGKGLEAIAAAASTHGLIFESGRSPPILPPIHFFASLSKHLTIKGYTFFGVVADPEVFTKAKAYVYNRLQSGTFKPQIDKTFPLNQIVAAHRYMESNAQIRKIVVTV